jgi:GT2 family glycosyltransferase/lipopolysaccharide/colanic/teichoic acid biosynthesis glycosyltransferase
METEISKLVWPPIAMRISVIIVNYNVRPFLENALVSIQKAMQGLTGEIIVVDNASDDGSAEMVQTKFPTVRLMVNEKNLGFAAANNLALREAKGDYFLLINPDTVIQEDTLRTMLGFFEEHLNVGLAGCKILNPDGTLQLACRRSFPTPWVALTKVAGLSALFPKSRLFGRYNLTYLDPDESCEVDAVSGSFMFLRRAAYERVGGLDEQFFMYGEDLDWCYRIQKAGWKIYYVPTTTIIHYKGESAKRSDIDELKLFYEAMHVFVRKHMRSPSPAFAFLRLGIMMRSWLAFLSRLSQPIVMVAVDWLLIGISIGVAEYIHLGTFFQFPSYADPVVLIVPASLIIIPLMLLGGYVRYPYALRRTVFAVVVGFTIVSAATFFFKEYAFSRMIVVYASIIGVIALPGWRVAVRLVLHAVSPSSSILRRRTLIVGTNQTGQELLHRLRRRLDNGYGVVGFIDTKRSRIGDKIGGIEILGSIDNINKVIREHNVSEVIFSADTLSYADILSVIGKSGGRSVNFRLVPSSLEVVIGKSSVDVLDDFPLVDIEYNINRPLHRVLKRLFDITLGGLLILTVYPLVRLQRATSGKSGPVGESILLLPRIFTGRYSLVGRPITHHRIAGGERNGQLSPYLGKQGMTGIVQINNGEGLTPEEIEQYILYYAKNQSVALDIEILFKWLFQKKNR